jgi:hypothetical protein
VIDAWMRQNVRKEPKGADWPTIRRVYQATLAQLQDLAESTRNGGDISSVRDYYAGTELGSRLQKAGLFDEAFRTQKCADVAVRLLSAEYRRTPRTIERELAGRGRTSARKDDSAAR